MDSVPPNPEPPPSEPDLNPTAEALAGHLCSLTRLLIGGAEVGLDELLRLLQVWEAEVERLRVEDEVGTILPGDGDEPAGASAEKSASRLRLAFIGWLFETEASLLRRASRLSRPEGAVGRWLRLAARPLAAFQDNVLYSPFRSRIDRWVERGEGEMRGWTALGREEDTHSRMLARVAFDKTVDEYIAYLTTNPEVKDLVQLQSTGLANEVIEEVRERTFSADTFLEGLARSLLHRLPRRQLPAPAPTLAANAAPAQPRSQPEEKH